MLRVEMVLASFAPMATQLIFPSEGDGKLNAFFKCRRVYKNPNTSLMLQLQEFPAPPRRVVVLKSTDTVSTACRKLGFDAEVELEITC